MSEEIIIDAHEVTKAYRIWRDPSQRLISPLLAETSKCLPGGLGRILRRRAATGFHDFFALQNVSFEVRRGEAVGIIGRNGAGKSTLLQLIAGTLRPTAGSIRINGRVAALLELGAGFNTEFTGRENVYLSGAVLGINQKEMETRFADVAAFADIGDFIEQPVKTYSSGMMMRLAFAVNTCVDPDVLIVDEALSVGDAPFQAKCFRRLRQLIDKGVSLLFVSHDLGTVRSICSRALWLKNGRAEMWNEAKSVAREYERFCWREQGIPLDESAATARSPKNLTGQTVRSDEPDPVRLLRLPNQEFNQRAAAGRIGTGVIRLVNGLLFAADGVPVTSVDFNQEATWHLLFNAQQDVKTDFVVGLAVFDLKDNKIAGVQNVTENLKLDLSAGQSTHITIAMRFPLAAGKYTVRVTLLGYQGGQRLVNGVYDFNRSIIFDQVSDAIFFEVNYHAIFPIAPPVCLHGQIRHVIL